MFVIKNLSGHPLFVSVFAKTERCALLAAIKAKADLTGADLAKMDLQGFDLSDVNSRFGSISLRDSDLRGARLMRGDNLMNADLSGAFLADAVGLPAAPVIPTIDTAILAAIEASAMSANPMSSHALRGLDMSRYHVCATTHCRAGWAVVLAGNEGAILEDKYGPNVAGALIYNASRPGQRVPNFFADNREALADIRECARIETLARLASDKAESEQAERRRELDSLQPKLGPLSVRDIDAAD